MPLSYAVKMTDSGSSGKKVSTQSAKSVSDFTHSSGSFASTKDFKMPFDISGGYKNILNTPAVQSKSPTVTTASGFTPPSVDLSTPAEPAKSTTTTYIPAASAAKTVATDTVTASEPSIFGDYDKFMQAIKEASEANTAFNIQQAKEQNAFQKEQNKIMMDFNAAEAAKNRDWQAYMSNTAHQREVADLQAAGLNPILSAMGGNGAAVTSGATASGVTSAGTKAEVDTGTLVSLLNFLNNTMGYALGTATAGINAGAVLGSASAAAEAARYSSDQAMAASLMASARSLEASKYSSDNAYRMRQDFPDSLAGLLASTGNILAQGAGSRSWTDVLAGLAKGTFKTLKK